MPNAPAGSTRALLDAGLRDRSRGAASHGRRMRTIAEGRQ
jgi:hypothetical protein